MWLRCVRCCSSRAGVCVDFCLIIKKTQQIFQLFFLLVCCHKNIKAARRGPALRVTSVCAPGLSLDSGVHTNYDLNGDGGPSIPKCNCIALYCIVIGATQFFKIILCQKSLQCKYKKTLDRHIYDFTHL